jgi:hypothetical protein
VGVEHPGEQSGDDHYRDQPDQLPTSCVHIFSLGSSLRLLYEPL